MTQLLEKKDYINLGATDLMNKAAEIIKKKERKKMKRKNPNQIIGVKAEFHAPCREKYRIALSALRFLCRYHNCEAILRAIRKDLKEEGWLK